MVFNSKEGKGNGEGGLISLRLFNRRKDPKQRERRRGGGRDCCIPLILTHPSSPHQQEKEMKEISSGVCPEGTVDNL